MNVRIAGTENEATQANAVNCKDMQSPLFFALTVRHVSPSKPWLMLMETCGFKERTAHNYASGHSLPDVGAMRDLLWSPLGYRTLKFIMEGTDNPPAWWSDFQMVVREMTATLERLK